MRANLHPRVCPLSPSMGHWAAWPAGLATVLHAVRGTWARRLGGPLSLLTIHAVLASTVPGPDAQLWVLAWALELSRAWPDGDAVTAKLAVEGAGARLIEALVDWLGPPLPSIHAPHRVVPVRAPQSSHGGRASMCRR
jgi:hypothetical protein